MNEMGYERMISFLNSHPTYPRIFCYIRIQSYNSVGNPLFCFFLENHQVGP